MKKQLSPFEYALGLCILVGGMFKLTRFIENLFVKLSHKPYIEIYDRLIIIDIIITIIIYVFVINVSLIDLRKPLASVCYFKRVDSGAWIAIILCAIGEIFFCVCYSRLIYYFGARWANPGYSDMKFLVYLVDSAIIPGVAEELIIKGLIFTILKRQYSTITSIIIASLMFAGLHLNPTHFIFFFLSSCYTFWIYLRTGNLILSMLGHFIYNLCCYLLPTINNDLVNFSLALGFLGLGSYLLSKLDKPELENITKQVDTQRGQRVSITKEKYR
jgi:membrane protease YdiL (CAAX protease family)